MLFRSHTHPTDLSFSLKCRFEPVLRFLAERHRSGTAFEPLPASTCWVPLQFLSIFEEPIPELVIIHILHSDIIVDGMSRCSGGRLPEHHANGFSSYLEHKIWVPAEKTINQVSRENVRLLLL